MNAALVRGILISIRFTNLFNYLKLQLNSPSHLPPIDPI